MYASLAEVLWLGGTGAGTDTVFVEMFDGTTRDGVLPLPPLLNGSFIAVFTMVEAAPLTAPMYAVSIFDSILSIASIRNGGRKG